MTANSSSDSDSSNERDDSSSFPRGDLLSLMAAVEADGSQGRRPVPFVWQHGNRLLLLTEEGRRWVFAELLFDQASCGYLERRRIVYEWEREAVGAVLSRALAAGLESVECATRAMNRWLLVHYGHSVTEAPAWRSVRSS